MVWWLACWCVGVTERADAHAAAPRIGVCDLGCWAGGMDMKSGVWDLASGTWGLGSGLWDLGYGVWDLGSGSGRSGRDP